jgi:hypothetical protein
MTTARLKCLVAIAVPALVALGCGDDSPTTPTPTTVQVGGVWTINETVASVTGGECFASAFQAIVGNRATGTAQIQQNGSALTATITDDATGGSCSYSGTAGTNSVVLNVQSCTASDLLGAPCPGSGALRNVRLQTGAINGTVTGGNMSGTEAQTYNVTTAAGTGVGTLTMSATFTATRR